MILSLQLLCTCSLYLIKKNKERKNSNAVTTNGSTFELSSNYQVIILRKSNNFQT